MRLANTVRDNRRRLDMTQADLGDRVGVSRQTIISIEGGDYVPSALLAARICREFGVKFEDLFTLEEESQ
jgi:putative transcriptional regulator